MDTIRLREACSIQSGGVGGVETSEAAAAVDVRRGREGGSLGGMVDAQIMLVELLSVGFEPAFGDGADEAATGGQVQMLRRSMFEAVNGV